MSGLPTCWEEMKYVKHYDVRREEREISGHCWTDWGKGELHIFYSHADQWLGVKNIGPPWFHLFLPHNMAAPNVTLGLKSSCMPPLGRFVQICKSVQNYCFCVFLLLWWISDFRLLYMSFLGCMIVAGIQGQTFADFGLSAGMESDESVQTRQKNSCGSRPQFTAKRWVRIYSRSWFKTPVSHNFYLLFLPPFIFHNCILMSKSKRKSRAYFLSTLLYLII